MNEMSGATGCTPVSSTASSGEPLDPRSILTSLGEVVYDWDLTSDRLVWGLNVREVLGLSDQERLGMGRTFATFVEPGSGLSRHDAIHGAPGPDTGSGVPYRASYALRTRDNRLIAVEDAGRWFAGSDGKPATAHGVLRVSPYAGHALAAGDDVPRGAARDRADVIADLAQALADAQRGRRQITLMVASLGDISRLNNEFGYETIDAIIGTAARRLSSVMRRRDLIARYGGNRFSILLASCTPDQAGHAARRFADAVERPVQTPLGFLDLKLRIGFVNGPEVGMDAAEFLRRAEVAHDAAKLRGGHTVYSPDLAKDMAQQGGGLDLIAALNERRVVIARQPVLDARTRRIAFEEVLARVARPDGSYASASEIIPEAERSGLVRLIDHRVLELAVAALAREPEARFAINVSPLTLTDPDWLPAFAAHLGAHAGIADRLIVEVTETMAISDPDATRRCLSAMKALGVAIAIDDFGSGHTSFKHLRSFPVDILKIDGAFVQNLTRSTDDRFFVRTLIDLAQHLGVSVVAEWVENEETAIMLTSWGVDYLQGTIGGLARLDLAQDSQEGAAGVHHPGALRALA